MERLEKVHLNPLLGHPRQRCPGWSLNLRPTAPQASILAKIYIDSLHCLLYNITSTVLFYGVHVQSSNSKVPNNKVLNYKLLITKFLIYKVPNVTMFLIQKKTKFVCLRDFKS
jgi:hypothetical protein